VTQSKAEPYRLCSLSLSIFDEFGIGISLYFRQLIFLAVIFFFAGIIYLPSLVNNYKYDPPGLPFIVKGSAVGAQRKDLKFGLTGMTDFAACVFLLLFAVVAAKVEDAVATHIDMAQQTPQDYAIAVKNPDPDLKDVQAYHDFFLQFGEVVYVGMAVTNGQLLKALARKREIEFHMSLSPEGQQILDSGSLVLQEAPHIKWYHRLLHKMCLYHNAYFCQAERLAVLKKIEELSQLSVRVKRVYVIFNKEQDKRECMRQMRVGLVHRWFKRISTGTVEEKAVFRGRRLRIREPVEPSGEGLLGSVGWLYVEDRPLALGISGMAVWF